MEYPMKTSYAKKLSADARMLIAIIGAENPLTYLELALLSRVNIKTVYRYMPILLNERIVVKVPCSLAMRVNFRRKEKCVILSQDLAKKVRAEWEMHGSYIRELSHIEERERSGRKSTHKDKSVK